MSAQPRIDDHAFLSHQLSGALVSREGAITWLCLPRFDSASVFTSLLGTREHGEWSLGIEDGEVAERAYLPGTLVLRTLWRSPSGETEVLDFMPLMDADGVGDAQGDDGGPDGTGASEAAPRADVMRLVRCLAGRVRVTQSVFARLDYGEVEPWVSRQEDADGESFLAVVAGGDALAVHGPDLEPVDGHHEGTTELVAGESAQWCLTWYPAWGMAPSAPRAEDVLEATVRRWRGWLEESTRQAPRADDPLADRVQRSLLVLKGLTHRATGGIVAAPTTSLPEDIGGVRNWDYRYVWLRDTCLLYTSDAADE